MPRFYFDIRENGRLLIDEDGTDLPNLQVAEREAIMTAIELVREAVHGDTDITVEVRDERGNYPVAAKAAVRIEKRTPDQHAS
jgi:hypothetical protein